MTMGNTCTLTLNKPHTPKEYRKALKDALRATFDFALDIETDRHSDGVLVNTLTGSVLLQWCYDSPTEWYVDHRLGEIGYWVAARMLCVLAGQGGTVREDCLGESTDTSIPPPRYFVEYVKHGGQQGPEFEKALKNLYGLYFTGPMAPFWKAP